MHDGVITKGQTMKNYRLNDGNEIPQIGFGTAALRGEPGLEAISSAIRVGYRHLDTAVNYDNEGVVGRAIRESGIPRDHFFITSKIPGRYHESQPARNITFESMQRLGVDYIDLMLIHWPNPKRDQYLQAWESLIQMQKDGWVKSIGVSNFTKEHLNRLIQETGVTPAVNQIELHPYFPQVQAHAEHKNRGILIESWSPLARVNRAHEDPAIISIAEEIGRTPAQVVLRWNLQQGALPLPKSSTESRQRENLNIFDFELSEQQLSAINALAQTDGRWFGGDPDEHEEL